MTRTEERQERTSESATVPGDIIPAFAPAVASGEGGDMAKECWGCRAPEGLSDKPMFGCRNPQHWSRYVEFLELALEECDLEIESLTQEKARAAVLGSEQSRNPVSARETSVQMVPAESGVVQVRDSSLSASGAMVRG